MNFDQHMNLLIFRRLHVYTGAPVAMWTWGLVHTKFWSIKDLRKNQAILGMCNSAVPRLIYSLPKEI